MGGPSSGAEIVKFFLKIALQDPKNPYNVHLLKRAKHFNDNLI